MPFYPGVLELNGELLKPVKVFQSGSTVLIYAWIAKKATQVAEVTDATMTIEGRNARVVGHIGGELVELDIERDKSCGCGNPLKRFQLPPPRKVGT